MENNNEFTNEESISIKEMLFPFFTNWKIILLSVIVFASASYFYLKTVTPMYEAKASVLIKDMKNSSNRQFLNELEFVMSDQGLLTDKIEVLKSRPNIEKVVEKENLHIQYFINNSKFNKIELFNTSPIKLSFKHQPDVPLNFIVNIIDSNSFKVEINEIFTGVFLFNEEIQYKNYNFLINSINSSSEWINKQIYIKYKRKGTVAAEIISSLSITPLNKSSNIINLSCKSENIEKAIVILNGIINEYSNNSANDQNNIFTKTKEFITERVSKLNEELYEIEHKEELFKSENNIISLPSQSELLLVNSSANENKLLEISTQLELISYVKDFIDSSFDGYELIPSKIGLNDANITKGIDEFNSIVLKRKNLLRNATLSNPLIQKIDLKLNQLKENITLNISKFESTLQITKNVLLSRTKSIKSKLSKIPTKDRESRNLKRLQQTKEALYLYLLEKREEVEISIVSTKSYLKIINSPVGSSVPVFPRKNIILLAGLLIGLALPVGLIYIFQLFDTRIKSIEEVENEIETQVISEIVKVSNNEGDKYNTLTIGESFRFLDVNLENIFKKLKLKENTILITSTVSGEGKSFIAVNYTKTLAMSGKKVLLIDGDIRAPKVLNYLGIESDNLGLIDYIKNEDLVFEDLIIKSNDLNSFDIIGSGKKRKDLNNYLKNDRLKSLINEAKGKYDYVIIDSPPVFNFSDSFLFGKYVGFCLYVLRMDYLDEKMLRIPRKLVKDKRFKNIGVVINDVDYSSTYYGYSSYGYYNYERRERGKWYKKII